MGPHAPISTSDLLNWETLKAPECIPSEWTKKGPHAFESLKGHLAPAAAWGLPNLLKPSQVHVHQRPAMAPGILTHVLRDIPRPITYLSGKLDHTVLGWTACLRPVTATCELLEEAASFPWDSLSPFTHPTKC